MTISSTDISDASTAADGRPRGERTSGGPAAPGDDATTGDAIPRRSVTSLGALPYGVGARVVSVEGEGAVALRLMEMGVVPGAPICLIKAAPLGDPVEVRVRGYHLALRRSEAETILVTRES